MIKIKRVIQNAKRCDDLYRSSPNFVKVALSRIDHQCLYSPFLAKVINAIESVKSQKKEFWVTQGLRTFEEQNALYAKGRTAPGGVITTVSGGQSAHNYGIAADAVFDSSAAPGLQPTWKKEDLIYWADAALEQGLDAGFYWKNFFDGPHVQLDIKKYNISPRKQLLSAHKKGGQESVFEFLDQYDWT